jgi:hypothetical protein
MRSMNFFTFNLLLLLQRVDEAMRRERGKRAPDRALLVRLRQRRDRLGERLRRSLAPIQAVEA